MKDWLVIAAAIVGLIAVYLTIGRIVDECIAYWRAWKEEGS